MGNKGSNIKKLWLVYTANFYRKTNFKALSVIIIGIAFKKNCGISLVYIIVIVIIIIVSSSSSSSSINESSWCDRVILWTVFLLPLRVYELLKISNKRTKRKQPHYRCVNLEG